MANLPNTPFASGQVFTTPGATVPAPDSSNLDLPPTPIPGVRRIVTTDRVGPKPTNSPQQSIEKRTLTLLNYIGAMAYLLDRLDTTFLRRDGSAPYQPDGVTTTTPGMVGDLAMNSPVGGPQIVGLGHIRNLNMYAKTTARGAWSNLNTYTIGDFVTASDSQVYICLTVASLNQDPTNPAYYSVWDLAKWQGATREYVDAETTRAEAAEASISGSVAAETTRAEAAEATLTSNLAAEVARARAAEGTGAANLQGQCTANAAAITAETSRATTAEGTIASNLTAETTRAEAAEGAGASNLQGQCTANAAAITAEANARATADTNEAVSRIAADNTLQNNINTEATTRATNDTALSAAITAETTRAEAAEAALATVAVSHAAIVTSGYVKPVGDTNPYAVIYSSGTIAVLSTQTIGLVAPDLPPIPGQTLIVEIFNNGGIPTPTQFTLAVGGDSSSAPPYNPTPAPNVYTLFSGHQPANIVATGGFLRLVFIAVRTSAPANPPGSGIPSFVPQAMWVLVSYSL